MSLGVIRPAAATALLALVLAYTTVTAQLPSLLLVSVIAGVALVVVAPRATLAIGITAMILPYTWSPSLAGMVVAPGIAVGALAAIAWIKPGKMRSSVFDAIVAAYVFVPAITGPLTGAGLGLFQHLLFNIAVPYLGFRVFFSRHASLIRLVPRFVIRAGVAVTIVGIYEEVARHNPTFDVLRNPVLAQWSNTYTRAGLVRIQSTLGHPVALGSFLLVPLAFAILDAKRNRLALVILLAGEALTLSRGPWLALAALLFLYLAAVRSVKRRVAVGAGVVVASAVLSMFVGPLNAVVSNTFSSGTSEAANAAYRLDVFREVVHHVTILGSPLSQLQTNQLLPGLSDIPSFAALTIARSGLIGLILLAWLIVTSFRVFVGSARRNPESLLFAFSFVLCGQLVALLFVPLVTNYQYFVWLVVALVAGSTAPELAGEDLLVHEGSRPVALPVGRTA